MNVINPAALRDAYLQVFPDATELPRELGVLHRQISERRRATGGSSELRVLDRMVASAQPSVLAVFLAGSERVSEAGRQRAAEATGRGDPRAFMRREDQVAPYRLIDDHVTVPALRAFVKRQIDHQLCGSVMRLPALEEQPTRNHAMFEGSPMMALQAADEYARVMWHLGVIASPEVFTPPPGVEGRALTRAVHEATRDGARIVFIDVEKFTPVLAPDSPYMLGERSPEERARGAYGDKMRALTLIVDAQGQTRVILGGEYWQLRDLTLQNEGLSRRVLQKVELDAP